ncbi:PR domain zinc finger protein 5-like [Toxorhynchites rutilus septentrionalis]|uniref:PR domain zinc finger protein 5-like n=1 Tax=Toxorhynchites rutilus septentrionalis TaxID=329112 RepID=UPI00247A7D7F|nr:PR domain zinc finger protein 5-like [Toxorhynchites rutilus septentrionalis]
MTIFNLKNFPNVCRLCLQSKSPAEVVALDSYLPLHGQAIIEMIEEITFKVPLEIACYLPMDVCEQCLEVFEFFYKYKQKLNLIQRFACCLADVKCENQQPLVDLFETDRNHLEVLFKDLNLCERVDFQAKDLLDEFHEYDIASMICIKVESDNESECEAKSGENHDTDADGCSEGQDFKLQASSFLDEFQKALEEQEEDQNDSDSNSAHVEFVVRELDEDSRSQLTLIEEDEDDDELEQDEEDHVRPAKRRRHVRLLEEEVELQTCNLDCKFSTSFPSQFEKHLAKMHLDDIGSLSCHRLSCDGELFDSIELLRQHKNDLHNTHICMVCGKVVKHLIALENHVKCHNREGEPTLNCTMCEEMFRTESELHKHIAKVHLIRFSFDCPECGLGFKQKLLLTQHLLTHSVERNFNCDQCGMAFKTSNHLRRHIRTVHTEIRYTCEHCHMSYGRRDKLRMHMERVHDIQTYFVCDICCTSFESDDKLQEHKNRHETPKDLECGICLAVCTNPDEFNEHSCITYQDDYVCCNRDFRYHSYYNRHMFLTHGVSTNARVKPKAGVLMGKQRAMRKPVERCTKCEHVFPTRKLKKQHMGTCEGQVVIFQIEPVAGNLSES